MGYNAKEYVESKNATPGTVLTGVIISISDGKARDFLKPEVLGKFKNPDGKAISLTIEARKDDGEVIKISQLIGYTEVDGKMFVKQTSNLGKYRKFYNKLPEVGDQVKLLSDANGFFKLML